jgi:hypothetical protein
MFSKTKNTRLQYESRAKAQTVARMEFLYKNKLKVPMFTDDKAKG